MLVPVGNCDSGPYLMHGPFGVSSWCVKTFIPASIHGAFGVSSWCVENHTSFDTWGFQC